MKRAMVLALVAGAGLALGGCEEKKADPVAAATDAAKKAGDAAKDSAAKATDAAKDVANKATDALQGEVKNLMDTVKGKVEALVKGGSSLTGEKKGEFDKAVTGIQTNWTDLSKMFDALKGQSGEGLMKNLTELKDKGTKLMDTVKTTADKFGIKI